jgi:hypothetical protein
MAKKLQIARSVETGEIVRRVSRWMSKDSYTLEDAVDFPATLRYESSYRTAGGVTATWKDVDTGKSYPMNLTEFIKVMKKADFKKGVGAVISGVFGFTKRGTSVSIKLITVTEDIFTNP